ncbi:MAG: D-glycero-beta-D-manno-heptose 1-phosphate adenylyltransferase [Bacteroidota bacterium]
MQHISAISHKILDWPAAQKQVQHWQDRGLEIVFTNGCFDLLHYGHLHYLAAARELGNKLVIGINGADSVRRLKGINRPINDEATRLNTLAALSFVDLVVSFPEDTPAALIQTLNPDILVKGGDYKVEDIVGADIVLEKGGQVKTLAFVPGYSTSQIEEKIRNSQHDKD